MELENLECQLAQAQMSRYLAGDQLPEDTVLQLQKHVSECPECQKSAEDKAISLETMLTEVQAAPVEAPALEVTEKAAPAPDPLEVSDEALASAMAALNPEPAPEPQAAEPVAEPKAKKKLALPKFSFSLDALKPMLASNLKPLLLGFTLGAVLIGMTAFMKRPTAVLGNKLATAEHEAPAEEKEAKPKHEAAAEEPAHQETKAEEPVKHDEPKHEEPKVETPKHEEHATPPADEPEQKYEVAKNDGAVVEKTIENGKKVAQRPVVEKPTPKPAPQKSVSPRRTTRKFHYSAPKRRKPVPKHRTVSRPDPKPGTGYVKVLD